MSFEGDVRVIRASTRQIVVANNDIQLYPGDTVQTQADGRARISMADGSTVVVRPNSTIIIRDNASAEDGKRSNVHVVVDSGQMLVRTQQQSEDNKNVIETPKTQNQISGQTAASFGVNPEGTEEIRVNSGAVESANRIGERTSLKSGEYVSVNQSGTVSKPQRLLDVPQPLQPRDLEKILIGGSGSATVPLRWQKPQSGVPSYYRVEVATSPFFVPAGKVIERDQLVVTQFNASDLRPGAYFWRIRATAPSGQTSDWSEPLKFIVATQGASVAAVPGVEPVGCLPGRQRLHHSRHNFTGNQRARLRSRSSGCQRWQFSSSNYRPARHARSANRGLRFTRQSEPVSRHAQQNQVNRPLQRY